MQRIQKLHIHQLLIFPFSQNIAYHAYIFRHFYLHSNCGELEFLTLKKIGKELKSKYLSELHAAQVTYSPITLR